ncbi:hypothetical protein VB715_12355 [Crocosphaera sp. UHCC 0190]|uniref:GumC family protein n=1 Tax=Crocosphaera sp. UHCC 0190 TaxID=3110246 RepID=UPI002B1EC14D|nr:hypothetical protein [Crocosphaera sp. UHCC 0190]MEA5510557.1 hypothetical protein [Crocosphaera sp. UHCC 0190]
METVTPKKGSSHRGRRWVWWLKYLGAWVLSNAVVWGLVWAYLKLLPPTYTTQWGLMILGPDPGVDLNLQEVGQASSDSKNLNRQPPYQDVRSDYVYIANSPGILGKAAKLVNLSVDDFGEPDITTDDNSSIISFEMTGDTPEQAKQKSEVLYKLLIQEINRLRETEQQRRIQETQKILESARQQLNVSKSKLANYRAKASLSSDEQTKALATNVEALRQQKAQLLAQEQALNAHLQQLSKDVDFSDLEVSEAYMLQADKVYQQQVETYGQLNTDLANLLSELGSEHPQVLEKKNQLDSALIELQTRASLLLGKQISQTELVKLAALTLDPKLTTVRQELFQDFVTTRSELQATVAQFRELDTQLDQLEKKLKVLTQEQSTIDSLKIDLNIAEAIFSTTVTKLDLTKGNIDIIYPPVQLVGGPNLPDKDKPTSPDLKIGLVGGVAGSFLITVGFILYWWEKHSPYSFYGKQSWTNEMQETNEEEEKG